MPDDLPARSGGDELAKRRWALVRDVLIFQAKMLLEGLRDLLLPLATLVAGAIGLAFGGPRPERPFQAALRLGARFDVWLNLFGPAGEPGHQVSVPPREGEGFDRYFQTLEQIIVAQHRRGRLTRSARQAIDGWLARLRRASGPPRS